MQHKIEQPLPAQGTGAKSVAVIKPLYVTDTVPSDTDDPAIWINQQDPGKSLVIGTDKNERGGLYVFDLKGKMDTTRSVRGLNRPNNVDIEYGFKLGGGMIDIAVATERYTHKLRIYSLPG
ncbi:MAG TPA: phytase, partial [Flavitalea sp.]|nr:phytase [Flavitalea sp.]